MRFFAFLRLTHLQINGPGDMKGVYKALWSAKKARQQDAIEEQAAAVAYSSVSEKGEKKEE